MEKPGKSTNNVMNVIWLLAGILVPTIIALTSPTLMAELFTTYDYHPKALPPGQHAIVVVNTGWVQADNVNLRIIADSAIVDSEGICVEGGVRQVINNNTLVMEFSRMLPQEECEIELTVNDPTNLRMEVNSDGRLGLWSSEMSRMPLSLQLVATVLLILLILASISPFIIAPMITRILYRFEWFNNLEVKLSHKACKIRNTTFVLHRNKFKKPEDAERIIKFVHEEYGWRINELDAKILKLIHQQKTTMAQLDKHFGFSMEHVTYRIKKMRRYELVSEEKMELHETLDNFFKHPWRLDDWLAEQPDEHAVPDDPNICNKQDGIGADGDRMSRRREYADLGKIIGMMMLFMLGLAQFVIFGNDLGIAWATFVTVTLVYLASSIVSKLALSAKLKKYNIMQPKLNPKFTGYKIILTLAIALGFGGLAGLASYLSPQTIEYSNFNYAMMIVIITAVPLVDILLSWFESR